MLLIFQKDEQAVRVVTWVQAQNQSGLVEIQLFIPVDRLESELHVLEPVPRDGNLDNVLRSSRFRNLVSKPATTAPQLALDVNSEHVSAIGGAPVVMQNGNLEGPLLFPLFAFENMKLLDELKQCLVEWAVNL